MTALSRTLTKGTFAAVAAGAMALASATPAAADDRFDRDRGGIGAEEIVAGAVVIGGIAALAGAFDGDRDRWRDRRWNDRRWDNRRWNNRRFDRRGRFGGRGDAQRAINRCINAAERQARRFGGWGFAQVTDIRDVDFDRRGIQVRGRMEVGDNFRFRDRFDRGRFRCELDGRGRPFIDFDGIRGLR
ncbi:hypothetical protein [Erythrobacter sp.]|jgi:hypothetical protein|uniref:hypothetical protein n=1 Tax=Erythrobacter sp. TaxID=1042 RepID=UPI002E9AD2E1|nr:hypothetical protein [Erythrobacter sp.]